MTRQEFIEEVCDFNSLKQFCYDEGCDFMDDIIEEYELSDVIDEDIVSAVRTRGWEDIRDMLCDIDECYPYYRINGELDYEALTDSDIDDLREEILSWADANDIFDEDDADEEQNEEVTKPQAQEPLEQQEQFRCDMELLALMYLY